MQYQVNRILLLGCFVLGGMHLFGQSGNVPMSRSINDRLLTELHKVGNETHTAIRPFRQRDVVGIDTLEALYPFLDGSYPDTVLGGSTKFRGGPLVDALVGFESASDQPLTYQAGAGFWAEADLGPKWSLHLNGQYWATALPSFLDSVTAGTQNIPGQGFASGSDAFTHYDVNGYVNFSPSKFFDFSLGRGKNFFGEGYRSLFLSENAYSYPYLRLSTNVWKIRYINLFSQMSDIRGAGGSVGEFAKKYTSMHYLSWNISKRVNMSVFESIVWQSNDSDFERGFDIHYLNPVIFYRPVEFGLGSPDNALLGFGFSFKVGGNGLIYTQLMFDEFLLSEIRAREGWFGNKQAIQLGTVFHNAFEQQGLDVRTEFNMVRPFMYTHSDTRQNYAHHGEALAHPFGSNFYDWLTKVDLRKGRWTFSNTLSFSEVGLDTGTVSFGNSIFRPENERPRLEGQAQYMNRGYFLLTPHKATIFQNELKASYLVAPISGLSAQVSYMYRGLGGETIENSSHHWFRVGISTYFRERDNMVVPRYVLP